MALKPAHIELYEALAVFRRSAPAAFQRYADVIREQCSKSENAALYEHNADLVDIKRGRAQVFREQTHIIAEVEKD